MKRFSVGSVLVLSLVGGALEGCGGNSGTPSTVSNGGMGALGGGGASAAGGTSASGGAGSGGIGGSGGSAGAVNNGPPEWLAYVTPDGIYVYDASTFPQTTPLKLAPPPSGDYLSGEAPLWSPDGSHLLYISGSSLQVWDMTGAMPSAPVTLATGLMPYADVQTTSWSPDGKSVLLLDNHSLSALDPTQPMPTPHLISSTVQLYQWSPTGGGLVIDDTDGVGVLSVTAGVPGAVQHLDAPNADWAWSHDGKYIGLDDQTAVMLFDVSVTPPKSTSVYPLNRTYASSPSFSADGSFFAFNDGDGTGPLHFAAVAAPGTVVDLKSPDGIAGGGFTWSPANASWIAFNTTPPSTASASAWFLADVSMQPVVAKPMALPGNGALSMWLPDRKSVLSLDANFMQLSVVDLSATPPKSAQFPLETSVIGQWEPSPDQKSLAYGTAKNLRVASFASPSATPKTLTVVQGDMDDFYFNWSPSGRYIILDLTTNNYKSTSLELVRADGELFSLPATLLPTTPSTQIGYAWRPVAPN